VEQWLSILFFRFITIASEVKNKKDIRFQFCFSDSLPPSTKEYRTRKTFNSVFQIRSPLSWADSWGKVELSILFFRFGEAEHLPQATAIAVNFQFCFSDSVFRVVLWFFCVFFSFNSVFQIPLLATIPNLMFLDLTFNSVFQILAVGFPDIVEEEKNFQFCFSDSKDSCLQFQLLKHYFQFCFSDSEIVRIPVG